MTIEVKSGGTWRTIEVPEVHHNNVWKTIQTVEVKSGGTWRLVYGGVVNLAGETITHSNNPGDAIAGIRFNTDGTIDSLKGTTYAQIDSGTDWIIPNGAAASDYEVRYVSGAFDVTPAAINQWYDLSVARLYYIKNDSGGESSNTSSFEIRKGSSGFYIDNGTYNFTANNTP